MERYDQLLISLLSAAIRNRQPQLNNADSMDWTAVFEAAKSHDVYAMLYPTVASLDLPLQPNAGLLSDWKKAALIAGKVQVQHISRVGDVAHLLAKSGIQVIALKGLALRELYPIPELRTMVDADLLVHSEDTGAAMKLLSELGYYQDFPGSKDIHLSHKDFLPIELHRELIQTEHFEQSMGFEKTLWDNAVAIRLGTGNGLALPPQDHLLHLCLHMAEHMLLYGFGIRQLCDLVLLVESEGDKIHWNQFITSIQLYGIERFVQSVFIICSRMLDFNVPEAVKNPCLEKDPHIHLLIQDILSGGIFGQSSSVRNLGNQLLRYSNASSTNRICHFFSYLFPKREKLGARYAYAHGKPFLYPLACIHRLVFNLHTKNLARILKTLILQPDASITVFQERSHLLQWLGLH